MRVRVTMPVPHIFATVPGINPEVPAAYLDEDFAYVLAAATAPSGGYASIAAVQAATLDPATPFVQVVNLGTWRLSVGIHAVAQATITSANGVHFTYEADFRGVNAKAFGCIADGAVIANRVFIGTDNTVNAQAAIDFSVYFALCPVYFPAGKYLIGGMLETAYGNGFRSCHLEGDCISYRGGSTFAGTALLFNTWVAGINSQGGRYNTISNITLCGKNWNWIESHGLGSISANTIDDIPVANWIDVAAPAAAYSRYAPYAAVIVDGRSGAKPASFYPDITYPSYGGSGQYNKSPSSATTLTNVFIVGFVVGVAIQPGDSDANGDFNTLQGGLIEMCAYGWSTGQTQAREMNVLQSQYSQVHTAFVNGVNGRQTGNMQGVISGTQVANSIQWMNFPYGPGAGQLKVVGAYSETLWRRGATGSASVSVNQGVSWDTSQFDLSLQTAARGYPTQEMESGSPGPHATTNCAFVDFYSVLPVASSPVWTNNRLECQSPDGTPIGARPNPYQQIASNATVGGLVFPTTNTFNRPIHFSAESVFFNLSTNVEGPTSSVGSVATTQRAFNVPIYSTYALPSGSPNAPLTQIPYTSGGYDKSGGGGTIVSATLVGTVLTVTFTGISDGAFMNSGGNPGDLGYDPNTGYWFFCRSRVGQITIWELQNGHRVVSGVYTYFPKSGAVAPGSNPFVGNVGLFYTTNARCFMPSIWTVATYATGSPILTAVGRADGFFGYSAEVVAGDQLVQDARISALIPDASAPITAVSGGGNTITLAGNPGLAATAAPLGMLISKPVANV